MSMSRRGSSYAITAERNSWRLLLALSNIDQTLQQASFKSSFFVFFSHLFDRTLAAASQIGIVETSFVKVNLDQLLTMA